MAQTASPNFLTPASVRLAQQPDFRLIGRQADLDALYDALMRKGDNARNNILLSGLSGVGLSSLVLNLQAAKENPEDVTTPADILGKTFFYLDNDLFSGDKAAVTQGLDAALKTLRSTPNAVLVVEDSNTFIRGLANIGATNLISKFMEATGEKHEFQTIFLGSYDDADLLYNSSKNAVSKYFSSQVVKDPSKEDLRAILEDKAAQIGEKYGVAISPEAVTALLKLIEKFPGIGSRAGFTLPRGGGGLAQPACAIELLENAAVAYSRNIQTRPQGLDSLEKTLADIAAAQEGKATGGEADDLSREELTALREKTQTAIATKMDDWKTTRQKIRYLRELLDKYPLKMQLIQSTIDRANEEDEAVKQAYVEIQAAAGDDAKIKQLQDDFFAERGIQLASAAPQDEDKSARGSFNLSQRLGKMGAASSDRTKPARDQLDAGRKDFEAKKAEYAALIKQAGSDRTVLTDEEMLAEFSRISKIEVSKLKQDESKKLLDLEKTLAKRVYGQDGALKAIADSVKSAKAGLKGKDEAIGAFFLLGPTGTGKTETARALAEALFGTEKALVEFSMGDFTEENSITQLIGAPPGYTGYETGGQLLEAVRNQPSSVVLFDEIEKAHPKLFNTFMGITDEHASIKDRRTGEDISFAETVLIFTSNIGAKYFTDPTLTFEKASALAIDELRHCGLFKTEFLARLNILCYNGLDPDLVVQIAKKNLTKLEDMALDKGITFTMSEEQIKQMALDVYTPWTGGRGPRDFIKKRIRPYIADAIIAHEGEQGNVEITYIPGKVGPEEIAQVRIDVEDGDYYEISEEVMKDKSLSSRLMRKTMRENPDLASEQVIEKTKAALDAIVAEKIEEKIEIKVKELEAARAVVDAKFVPAAATDPKAAANQNAVSAKAAKPAAR
jgi:ATP-dependent Clp protease ATP-binding subunit ClpB